MLYCETYRRSSRAGREALWAPGGGSRCPTVTAHIPAYCLEAGMFEAAALAGHTRTRLGFTITRATLCINQVIKVMFIRRVANTTL